MSRDGMLARSLARSTVENCPSFVVDSFLSRARALSSCERCMAERKKEGVHTLCTKQSFSLKGFSLRLGEFEALISTFLCDKHS